MNPVTDHEFLELHTVHQHQPHCKRQCFAFPEIADIELPNIKSDGSFQSFRKENMSTIQRRTGNGRRILTVLGAIFVCIALAGGIPLALQLRSSSLLEVRLSFIRRLLTEHPLVEGYWSPKSDQNFSINVSEVKNNFVGAALWPITVPCGAQYLDAVQLALENIDEARRKVRKSSGLKIVESADEMKQAHSKKQISVLLGIAGGHALGASLAVLRSLYTLGIRFISITSLGCTTPWAGAAIKYDHIIDENCTNTLTDFGQTVVHEMNRLGMLVEISQLSETAMIVAMKEAKAPVLISNAAPLFLCNSTDVASIPDHILRYLPQNGGIVMLNMERCGERKLTIPEAIKIINYTRKVAGVDHVGLSGAPKSYPFLLAELARDRIWGSAEIKKLVGVNIVRVLREVESKKNQFLLQEEWIPRDLIEENSYCRYPET